MCSTSFTLPVHCILTPFPMWHPHVLFLFRCGILRVLFFWRGESFRFIYCVCPGACKHPSQVGPIVERAEEGPEQHISCMNLEWQELIIDWCVETFACNDGSEIAASAYQCGHNGKLLRNHERHYAVA